MSGHTSIAGTGGEGPPFCPTPQQRKPCPSFSVDVCLSLCLSLLPNSSCCDPEFPIPLTHCKHHFHQCHFTETQSFQLEGGTAGWLLLLLWEGSFTTLKLLCTAF